MHWSGDGRNFKHNKKHVSGKWEFAHERTVSMNRKIQGVALEWRRELLQTTQETWNCKLRFSPRRRREYEHVLPMSHKLQGYALQQGREKIEYYEKYTRHRERERLEFQGSLTEEKWAWISLFDASHMDSYCDALQPRREQLWRLQGVKKLAHEVTWNDNLLVEEKRAWTSPVDALRTGRLAARHWSGVESNC